MKRSGVKEINTLYIRNDSVTSSYGGKANRTEIEAIVYRDLKQERGHRKKSTRRPTKMMPENIMKTHTKLQTVCKLVPPPPHPLAHSYLSCLAELKTRAV